MTVGGDSVENKKITSHQLFTFTALSTLGGSILVASSTIATAAGRDAWLSGPVTIASGLVMMWVYCYLGTRFEGLTLIGMLRKVFGKWLGTIVSGGYFVYFFVTAYGIPWYIGGFGSSVMPETPVLIPQTVFIAVIIVGLFYGIETVARASEVFITVFTVLFLGFVLLVLPNAKVDYILPVLENGISPVLKGSIFLSAFVSIQNITVLMIYPIAVKDKKAGKKAVFKGFLWANAIVSVNIFIAILVLGHGIVADSAFATILLAREINVMAVLTRMEYVVSVVWLLSEFVIGFLYFYATTMSASEIIGLKDHRKIILPFGLIMLVISLIDNPGTIEHADYILGGYVPLAILFGFIVPVIMLAVYVVRRITNPSFGIQSS